ncbi:hypothetical protein BDV27DRAFT_137805 [Aspergillus caelatus]|uniref:Uncharacterized protein n=1 Tax=Aspergillus caelatus TaxID=61420 RepID=A0A5N6ZQC1_9EURO|nr:uncharacterized protein BDV27DRAFT_137805 [Aspergillus caelatus]KAE8358390.1 hypothetical protein BDV27DRAFT_137805 [Aspergillus caelatus]
MRSSLVGLLHLRDGLSLCLFTVMVLYGRLYFWASENNIPSTDWIHCETCRARMKGSVLLHIV